MYFLGREARNYPFWVLVLTMLHARSLFEACCCYSNSRLKLSFIAFPSLLLYHFRVPFPPRNEVHTHFFHWFAMANQLVSLVEFYDLCVKSAVAKLHEKKKIEKLFSLARLRLYVWWFALASGKRSTTVGSVWVMWIYPTSIIYSFAFHCRASWIEQRAQPKRRI